MTKTDARKGDRHKTTAKTFRFDDDQIALLEKGRARYGSYTAAIIVGLECAFSSKNIPNVSAAFIAELRQLIEKHGG